MDFELPLIGMQRAFDRIDATLRQRQPLLVLGAPGAGKTKLIKTAINREGGPVAYIVYRPILHDLLIAIANALIAKRHSAFSLNLRGLADPGRWVAEQTSLHLKGLLWTALEAEPLTIVLDGVDGASSRTYRFLQRIYHTPGACMLATARSVHLLGMLGRLFWNPRAMLQLEPLERGDAVLLFDMLVERLGLGRLDIDDFRARALQAARGNPGQIVSMCELAADPKYWSGCHIKFAPLRIDAYTRQLA